MDAIDTLLTRGVDKIYPSREALEKVLRSGKKLRLYQGFDPTGTQFHIGHAVGLRKLRQWQDLGHHVIFLIGDGTGLAGDPSGKTRSRGKFLTRQELRANARDYVMQASRIVRFDGTNPVEILHNSDWLVKLTLPEILEIAGHFSWQQLAERDLYQERIKSGETLNFREALYPLLQGYDSVAMKVDLELGGTDQTFNMLAGRQLVRAMQGREKFVMTTPLLTDAKGVKIGKTEGNVIGITDPATDFFGKIMSLGDDAIIPCFTLLTDTDLPDIEDMKQKLLKGDNPMMFKKKLAFALTAGLNSTQAAQKAQAEFEKKFQEKDVTTADLPTITKAAFNSTATFSEALVAHGLAASRSEAKRLIQQAAVSLDGKAIKEDLKPAVQAGTILKVGKTRFTRIVE